MGRVRAYLGPEVKDQSGQSNNAVYELYLIMFFLYLV